MVSVWIGVGRGAEMGNRLTAIQRERVALRKDLDRRTSLATDIKAAHNHIGRRIKKVERHVPVTKLKSIV